MPVFLHHHESIVFVVDLDADGSDTIKAQTRTEALASCCQLFVQAKHRMSSHHRYGLTTVQGHTLSWNTNGLTTSPDVLCAALRTLTPNTNTCSTFDLGVLLDLFGPLAAAEAANGRKLRVVLLYVRSNVVPTLLTNLGPGGLALDVVYVHERPVPQVNCPQQVFSALEDLGDALSRAANHPAYIFECSITGSVKKLTHLVTSLLSHPAQRLPQQQLRPAVTDLARLTAVDVAAVAARGCNVAPTLLPVIPLSPQSSFGHAPAPAAPGQAASASQPMGPQPSSGPPLSAQQAPPGFRPQPPQRISQAGGQPGMPVGPNPPPQAGFRSTIGAQPTQEILQSSQPGSQVDFAVKPHAPAVFANNLSAGQQEQPVNRSIGNSVPTAAYRPLQPQPLPAARYQPPQPVLGSGAAAPQAVEQQPYMSPTSNVPPASPYGLDVARSGGLPTSVGSGYNPMGQGSTAPGMPQPVHGSRTEPAQHTEAAPMLGKSQQQHTMPQAQGTPQQEHPAAQQEPPVLTQKQQGAQ